MPNNSKCTIEEFPFARFKNYFDEVGNLVRCEMYNKRTNCCYMSIDYFYYKDNNLLRKIEEVNNEQEHSQTETLFREEGEYGISESIKRYQNPTSEQRDERCIERYRDAQLSVKTYDLLTGKLICDELYEGDECLYYETY